MKKIVTIGGGTGHYTLLRGLKNYDVELTAIVSVADNGGSSGRLRVEFGVLPPGDIRNCLLALADEIKLKEIMDLFDYRFPTSSNANTLANHNLGNIIITALTQKYGDIGKAIQVASEILNISGSVLPITLDNTDVFAQTEKRKKLKGQVEVSYPAKDEKIIKLWLDPPAHVYKKAAQAIREANIIVICPGDLYGSILPNFLVEGVKEAINESKAKLVYVCNLVTKQGTWGYKASDFVKKIEEVIGRKIDVIICNTKRPTQRVVDKYKQEDSFFVEPDIEGKNVIKEELLVEYKSDNKIIARHDAEKTARIIMGL